MNQKQTNNNDAIKFKEIVKNRRSWRKFSDHKISDEIINDILDSVTYSPSSFGLEPWKIIVISNQEIKQKLEQLSFNQTQISNCSHLFLILSYKSKMFDFNNSWMKKRCMLVRNLEKDNEYENFYQQIFLPIMSQINDWEEWSIRQGYLALQTIMLAATSYQLATSPIEGIHTKKIVEFLEESNIIPEKEHKQFVCPVVLALGYKDQNYLPRKKSIEKIKSNSFIVIK